MFCNMIYGDSNDDVRKYLFVDHGDKMDAESIGNYVASCLYKYTLLKLKPSQYRHVAVAYGKLLGMEEDAHDKPNDDDATFSNTIHEQSGHSAITGNTSYGISNLNLRSISSSQIQLFLSTSKKWHSFIGHATEQYQSSPSLIQTGTLNESNPKPIQTQRSILLNNKIENIENILERMFSVSSNAISPLLPIPKPLPSTPNVKSRFLSLQILKEFFNDKESEFKSVSQLNVISLTLQGNNINKLVILPTGGGKSLLFMLPAYRYPQKTNIVIVPLVSLAYDLKRRCDEYNLSAVLYDENRVQEIKHYLPSIILCSHENLETESFSNLMNYIIATDHVGAIYIDEVHTVLDWQDFRESITNVRRMLAYDCLKIAMTATLPKQKERELTCCLGEYFEVYREPTMRRNVKYSVINYPNANQEELKAILVDTVLKKYETLDEDEKMIVYCMTKYDVEDIKERLTETIGQCSFYHSSIERKKREEEQRVWLDNDKAIMVATSAFTMGIDYPKVVSVFVYTGMYSLWELEQCAGRVRRDNQDGEFTVLTSNKLIQRYKHKFEHGCKIGDWNDLDRF